MNIKLFKKIYEICKKYIKYFILSFVFLLGGLISNLYITNKFSFIINEITKGDFDTTQEVVFSLSVVIGLSTIFQWLQNYFNANAVCKSMNKIRGVFINKIIMMPYPKLCVYDKGDIMTRFNKDMSSLYEFLSNGLNKVVVLVINFIGVFIYLIYINWKLTLICCAILSVLTIFITITIKSIDKLIKSSREADAVALEHMRDSLYGYEVVKTFMLQEELEKKYEEKINIKIKRQLKVSLLTSIGNALSIAMAYIPEIIVTIIGGYLAIDNKLSIGELFVFITLLSNISEPFTQIPILIVDIKNAQVSLERFFEIVDNEDEYSGKESNENIEPIIEFKDVSFSYKEGQVTINKMNFKVKPGQIVHIVGDSGCGKSTIFKLITNLYNTDSGQILIGDKEISKWNIDELRNNISVVSQDTHLFSDSIYENLKISKEDIGMEEIENIIAKLGLTSYIDNLPDGYNTMINETNSNVSGGQKQRIALARGLLKNYKILLLDEVTSGLDSGSINSFYDIMNNLKEDKTVLIITHNIYNLKSEDFVMYVQNGEVNGFAQHEELLQSNQQYKNFYDNERGNK